MTPADHEWRIPGPRVRRAPRADVVLGSDAARAVGRFRPEGPLGYRAKSLPDGPLRATRAEAEADERAFREGQSQ